MGLAAPFPRAPSSAVLSALKAASSVSPSSKHLGVIVSKAQPKSSAVVRTSPADRPTTGRDLSAVATVKRTRNPSSSPVLHENNKKSGGNNAGPAVLTPNDGAKKRRV
eukprot:GDKK01067510.1.p2 GENE.GDKK01067510.1~~GDKK01067510.1.p2  ORF type:complete len:108 (+),score=20.23 GDKK01067510.1:1-324(+)